LLLPCCCLVLSPEKSPPNLIGRYDVDYGICDKANDLGLDTIFKVREASRMAVSDEV